MPPKRKGKVAVAKVEEKKPKLDNFVAARRQSSRQSTVKAQELIKKQSKADSTDEDLEESDDDFVLPDEQEVKKSSAGVVIQPVNSFLSSEDSSGEDDDEEEEEEEEQPKKAVKPRAKRTPKKSEPLRVVGPKFKKNTMPVSDRCVLSSDSEEDFEEVSVPKPKSTPAMTITKSSDSESDMEDVQESEANLHELFPMLTQQEPNQDTKKENFKKKADKASKSATLDVSQLLAMGESQEPEASTSKPKAKRPSSSKKKAKPVVSDESDWEEVEHGAEHQIPKEGVEVKIEGPNNLKKKKSKTMDMEAIIKRRINQVRREKQVEMHKASLLCHLSHGMVVNRMLSAPTVMAVALSILPSQQCYPPKQTDIAYVEKMTAWFKKKVTVVEAKEDQNMSLVQIVEKSFTTLKAPSKKVLVFMFVAMLRSLGIKSRLIISLQPLPLKLGTAELLSTNVKPDPKEDDKKKKSDPKKPPPKQEKSSKKPEKAPPAKETKSKQPSKPTSSKSKVEKPAPKSKRTKKETESKYFSQGSSGSSPDVQQKLKSLRARKGGKYKEESSDDSDIEIIPSKKKKSVPQYEINDEDDFKPEVLRVVKNSKIAVKDRRALSTDSERADSPKTTKTKKKLGNDFWVEVFVEMEEKWISVDVVNGKVHCVELLHSKATTPILYIMGFGQDESVRDVTRRYCPQYHTTTRKQRVEQDWWDEATVPFYGKKTAFDKEEEEDMNKQLQDRPVPKTLSELKNHPLYVLKRHLLKFEGIYPPEAPPLGFFKDEPIYARECVFTLRSRETWVKEAKVVKLKETPYKVVKARPKYDRMSGQMMDCQPLEIFGPWQTEDYVAPPAENGKVPRNEYGNVELFKACMLPKGAVHLRIGSLNKTAKKLGIDCAPAMVGFDYHCGGCHPVYDGFVVCEEFKDTLIDAHRQEEEERLKRGEEKRLKRIYGNWRRLVNALFVREKLLRKYDFSQGSSKSKKKTAPEETASTSKMSNGTQKKVSSKSSK